jgi:hypothetical protein
MSGDDAPVETGMTLRRRATGDLAVGEVRFGRMRRRPGAGSRAGEGESVTMTSSASLQQRLTQASERIVQAVMDLHIQRGRPHAVDQLHALLLDLKREREHDPGQWQWFLAVAYAEFLAAIGEEARQLQTEVARLSAMRVGDYAPPWPNAVDNLTDGVAEGA